VFEGISKIATSIGRVLRRVLAKDIEYHTASLHHKEANGEQGAKFQVGEPYLLHIVTIDQTEIDG